MAWFPKLRAGAGKVKPTGTLFDAPNNGDTGLLPIDAPVYKGAINRSVGPALPFNALPLASAPPSGGNVTLSLSGQTATFSEGVLTATVSYSASGQTATFSEGTPTATVSYTLGAQTATFTEGTVTPALSTTLGSQTATFAEGALSTNVSYGLNGQTATFSEGTVTATGGDAPAALGYINRSVGPALPFQSLPLGYPPSANVTITLGGQTATFSLGQILAQGGDSIGGVIRQQMGPAFDFQPSPRGYTSFASPDVTVSLSGQTASFVLGTPTATVSYAVTGQTFTATEGAMTGGVGYSAAGQTATFSEGALTPSIAYSAGGQTATFTEGAIAAGVGTTLGSQTATFAEGALGAPALAITLGSGTILASLGNITQSGGVQSYTPPRSVQLGLSMMKLGGKLV